MATDRILVHSSIADRFITALKNALAAGASASALPPTLINTASKTRVQTLVSNALAAGAHFISGSADMPLPADAGVRRALGRARVGQLVALDGYLVDANRADGWHWRTSLTRDDTGDGACELFYVTSVDVPAGQVPSGPQ